MFDGAGELQIRGDLQHEEQPMKTITTLLSATVLIAGLTVAAAQNANEPRGPAANPTTGGANSGSSMSNPPRSNPSGAPTTSGAANPGSTKAMDEQANGTGQAVERNPDGSPGGSKSNPSPR
jgi:hypothetical protein